MTTLEMTRAGVNRKGEVVFDDGKKDGNLFLVNDGVGKIKDLAMLKNNSIQLAKYNVWIGTDQQKLTMLNPNGNLLKEDLTGFQVRINLRQKMMNQEHFQLIHFSEEKSELRLITCLMLHLRYKIKA